MVEIPGDPPPLTELQAVKHGTTHRHLYDSSVTESHRAAVVYTPPGYSPERAEPYPLLVLCHGFGDDETAWTEVGRAHLIVDNLVAAGTIEPLVIAMPNGHPIPLMKRGEEDYDERNTEAMLLDVVEELLPLVESNYHVATTSQRRAIAGLSMGGGHAISIGMSHPDLFAAIGAFSSAAPEGDLAVHHPSWLPVNNPTSSQRQLFWIACGEDDSLLQRNRSFNDELNRQGITHTYVETKGDHSWPVWRDYLPRFLKQFAGEESR
mgnify:FL=1